MENKNNTIVSVLMLIIGILIGMIVSGNGWMGGMMSRGDMYEEMDEHMYADYGDELVASDGAMQHAMEEMMLNFRGKEGVEFEEVFLKGMIVHHLGAIEMAEMLLKETKRPELIEMANNIVSAQTGEVEMMKGWLTEWFVKTQ